MALGERDLHTRRAVVAGIATLPFALTADTAFAEEPKDKDPRGKNNQNGGNTASQPAPRLVELQRPLQQAPATLHTREVHVNTVGQAPIYQGPITDNYRFGQLEVTRDTLIGVAGGSVLRGRFPQNGMGDLTLVDRGPVIANALIAVVSPVDTNKTAVIGVDGQYLQVAASTDFEHFSKFKHDTVALTGTPESAKVSNDGNQLFIQTSDRYVAFDMRTGRFVDLSPDANGKPAQAVFSTPRRAHDGSYIIYGANEAANGYDKVTAYVEGTARPRVTSETRTLPNTRGTIRLLNSYIGPDDTTHLLIAAIITSNQKDTDDLWDVDPSTAPLRIQINTNNHGRLTGTEPLVIHGAARDLTSGDFDWYMQVNNAVRPSFDVEKAPNGRPLDVTTHYNMPNGTPYPGLLYMMEDQDRGYHTRRLILVGANGKPASRSADTDNPNVHGEVDQANFSWRLSSVMKAY